MSTPNVLPLHPSAPAAPHSDAISPTSEIIAELAAGRMVILVDEEDRENEGDLIVAAEKSTAANIGFIVRHTSGVLCVSLEDNRLQVS